MASADCFVVPGTPQHSGTVERLVGILAGRYTNRWTAHYLAPPVELQRFNTYCYYDISAIAGPVTVTTVVLSYAWLASAVASYAIECREVLTAWANPIPDPAVWDEMMGGTLLAGFTPTPAPGLQTQALNAAAVAHVQAAINAAQGWWALGLRVEDAPSGGNGFGNEFAELGKAATYPLTISYEAGLADQRLSRLPRLGVF